MIPVYICEDEQPMREHIAQLAESLILIENYDMGPVYTAANQEELLAIHQPDRLPAIYLFDVDLKGELDGFELAAKIRKLDPGGYIIFITGHGDLSFKTFRYRLEAMEYIVKGDEEQLRLRLGACFESVQQRLRDEQASKSSYYAVKIFDTIRLIPVQQLLYFKADGKQHRVFLHTENEIIEFFGSLQAIENELGDSFFRTCRGYLVNRKKIVSIHLKDNLVELDNGEACPLSRSARKSLQQILAKEPE